MAQTLRDYDKVRERQHDLNYRESMLILLERIAESLEKIANPMYTVESNSTEPVDLQEEDLRLPEDRPIDPDEREYRPDADYCDCKSDTTVTCSACSAARLAWVLKMRGEM